MSELKVEELKPCPFCGGTTHTSWLTDDETGVRCETCFTDITHMPGITWNTRPIEDALQAQLTELQAVKDAAERRLKKIVEDVRKHGCFATKDGCVGLAHSADFPQRYLALDSPTLAALLAEKEVDDE